MERQVRPLCIRDEAGSPLIAQPGRAACERSQATERAKMTVYQRVAIWRSLPISIAPEFYLEVGDVEELRHSRCVCIQMQKSPSKALNDA
jgi:hypothetical protein